MALRQRTRADLDVVIAWVTDPESFYLFSGPRLKWPLSIQQLSKMERDSHLTAWMGNDAASGRPVGRFDITQQEEVTRIGRFIIDPTQRGRGLASQLLDLAVAKAQSFHATRIALNVIAGNRPVIRTYARAGFKQLSDQARPDVIAMELRI